MLTVEKAICGYKKEVVLSRLSVSVDQGEILSIIGANGIGKTTLFKSILGHIRLISGQILADGRDLSRLNSVERAKCIAYVPQAHVPPFPFRVIDVAVMGRTAHLKLFSKPSEADIRIAAEALKITNIEGLYDKTYTRISGGERQLVLIARAIAQEAKILIMDEPMANLDFGNQLRIMEQIRQLASLGLSVIYTTHNPEHAFHCSDKVLAIKGKTDFVQGSAEEVITDTLLQEIYQIKAEVKEVLLEKRSIRVCVPAG